MNIFRRNRLLQTEFRPKIHFTAEKNRLSDPNGCFYKNGTYHLFYQYNPNGNYRGPMHWGHAISTDLINWKDRGIAIYPDEADGMAFSGSAVCDIKNVSSLFGDNNEIILFLPDIKKRMA